MNIPMIDLASQYQQIKPNVLERMNRVLDHGQYIMGPEVRELEHELEKLTSAKHCITVSSGTDALLMSLMALDIGPGDEVITTSLSFIATAEVIVRLGAKPVFVDIDEETFNIDVAKLERAVSKHTKAIMPVALYGQPADMEEINALAERHGGIPVIEDAAQSLGATYQGKQSCNLSTMGCTSFFPSKPLGCYGDGGAIFTNDDELAEILRSIRIHGQSKRYHSDRVGIGGRMDTLQCAIVLAKLEKFDEEIRQREVVGRQYEELLSSKLTGYTGAPKTKADRSHVFAQYTLRLENRDKIKAELMAAGIPTAIHYPKPLNSQEVFKKYFDPVSSAIASIVAKEVLSLPMSAYITLEQQEFVVDELAKASL